MTTKRTTPHPIRMKIKGFNPLVGSSYILNPVGVTVDDKGLKVPSLFMAMLFLLIAWYRVCGF